MQLKIGISGTRGIPNYYGGYEQCVSFLAKGLADRGHMVSVYNSHNHPWKLRSWNGVEIIHCKDPEYRIGTAGQFLYDLNCLRDAQKKNYDILLMMGYTSSSVWGRFYPKKTVILTNMDGLEWKRSKYSRPVQEFLKFAEGLAIRYSDFYIADSPAIQEYLAEKYKISSRYIPYGAEIHGEVKADDLKEYKLSPYSFYLLLARMEPENNIETILDGYCSMKNNNRFVVIGDTKTPFGKKMLKKFSYHEGVRFLGPLFDQKKLNTLRRFCKIYFHGHSVGGTNPSLLEAMASEAQIAAHDNPFNKAVTGQDAYYFRDKTGVMDILIKGEREENMIRNNLEKIRSFYNWEKVVDEYESLMIESYNKKKK